MNTTSNWMRVFFLGCILFLVPTLVGAEQQDTGERKHLLLILVPSLSFNEIEELIMPLPNEIQQQIQLAGMSMRTGGGINLSNNIITLSTGHREVGVRDWNAYQLQESIDDIPVQNLYRQWAGQDSQAPIVHPGIFKLREEWRAKEGTETGPGWLGEKLSKRGISTYALGNSDVYGQKQRMAATFIMNREGEADGVIGEEMLSTDPYFPTGKKTNWERLSTEIKTIWHTKSDSLTVLELGDLERIISQKGSMDPLHYDRVRQEWFQEWGAWVNTLDLEGNNKLDDTKVSLWVLSPMISSEAHSQGQDLAPFFTWDREQSYGLLSSNTTKQAGVVANLDLLPSILHFFNLKQPSELVGKVMNSQAVVLENERNDMISLHNESIDLQPWLQHINYLFAIYDQRRNIITAYILIVIFILIASTLYWWFYKHYHGSKIIQVTIGAILISPVYFLWLTPLIQFVGHWSWITILLLSSLITSLLLYLTLSSSMFLAAIGGINTGAILFDIWQGSDWMKRSFLGYDPLIGARNYGLGNEYAGILLGSSILGVTGFFVWLMKRNALNGKKEFQNKTLFFIGSSGLYTLTLYLVAAPQYGTNAGATLASLVTYVCSQVILFQVRLKIHWIFLFFVIFGLSLIGFSVLHLQGEHTHIGSFLRMLTSGEIESVMEIVRRKWEMNMKLIRVSLWGKLFATTLLVLIIFLFRMKRERFLKLRQDVWFNGFRSIVLGAVLILLLNDSGIVAAATTMIFVTFPFIFLRFGEEGIT
jgi:hypothetical protein